MQVVEVGLGGRLDATSVVHPAVSAVVSIGLDHTELGPTLRVLPRRRQIFRKSVPAVVGQMKPLHSTLCGHAASRQTPLWVWGEDYQAFETSRGPVGTWTGGTRRTLALPGAFQVKNAGVALTLINSCSGAAFYDSSLARRRLARVGHAGRLEWLSDSVLLMVLTMWTCSGLGGVSERPSSRLSLPSSGFGSNNAVHWNHFAPQVDHILTTSCAHLGQRRLR